MRQVLLLFILFLARQGMAQECTQAMPATMVDEETGTFISGITADRLHAKVGSVRVPITRVERIPSFRVLILFDTSGSMEQKDTPFMHQRRVLPLIDSTLDGLVGELPQGSRVEYGLFNDNAVFSSEFTSDVKKLRQSLLEAKQQLKPRELRKTALYDAIGAGLARFDRPQPGDSMIIVTDGEDNKSRLTAAKVQEEAARKGVRVFTILIEGNDFGYQGEGLVISDLAEHTGGSVHVVNATNNAWIGDKMPELERRALRRFWNNEVLAGYLLHFSVPTQAEKRGKWTLTVDRLPGQKSKPLVVYPRRLQACLAVTDEAR